MDGKTDTDKSAKLKKVPKLARRHLFCSHLIFKFICINTVVSVDKVTLTEINLSMSLSMHISCLSYKHCVYVL